MAISPDLELTNGKNITLYPSNSPTWRVLIQWVLKLLLGLFEHSAHTFYYFDFSDHSLLHFPPSLAISLDIFSLKCNSESLTTPAQCSLCTLQVLEQPHFSSLFQRQIFVPVLYIQMNHFSFVIIDMVKLTFSEFCMSTQMSGHS